MIAASTTSLTVPPRPARIAFTSARLERAQAHLRCGPIGPLSVDGGVGAASLTSDADPLMTSASWRSAWRGARVAERRPRSCSYGLTTRSTSVSSTSRAGLGWRSGTNGSVTGRAGSGSRSSTTVRRSVPETPSTMQWWVLHTSAQWPLSRPCTTHISHSGLAKSSCWDITRPTSVRSSSSPPGEASAVARTW